jgi:NAD(P)H-nitrite reductase large subunit
VIGNGIAGQTAAEGLEGDADASIVMIAAERYPLNRVALPRYLRGQVRREKVLMRTVEDYANRNLEIHFETWAIEIDARAAGRAQTNRGRNFHTTPC